MHVTWPVLGREPTFDIPLGPLCRSGNVYTVTISKNPHCSCPDHAKGNVCKHILFVMLRAIRLPPDDPLVWQRALLKGEVPTPPTSFPRFQRTFGFYELYIQRRSQAQGDCRYSICAYIMSPPVKFPCNLKAVGGVAACSTVLNTFHMSRV